ncbi:protein O-GlcNAcase [Musca domestica]|uniref:protein O-GlcNAcase n=2 Tax=Musca domestica TaxID=7370 RepID=A0A1I8N3N6_MUSDO|nr:protein O-GlcNAcase [Musca domestica]XP_011291673.1 protein O-GlcNAcase [Musca domestica]XP_058981369.1 protein O-GlcNAcase [Musca domestica]
MINTARNPEDCASADATNKEQQKPNFICGVIEGFYGRPWTTEQRKDLFRKLKKWGMDSYVYAPKDDYKHRAYWRELYTVEEADHLSGLISAAKEHGITFYYALSPGLDMTYSSQKELQTLKRKLDQVSQFGCEAFALLFDDIESELSKGDKEVFQTFANAQVSVTNEIFTHLGNPRFLFCPTQYCSSRAVPTVHDSEYLNTLGSKLNHDIDIMWTGDKVISKIISVESLQEITEVLRRPPVIWDNLHANDYDQKRVFLGPYSGRSPEIIPHLRGVMTNPNCEFHANNVAIHTLAYWSRCVLDSRVNSSISADIRLETENDDENGSDDLPVDCCLSKNIYHPRMALKNAISEWLPEFFLEKEAWGPITKPQPQVTLVMPIIPIIPSINTCMSLTTTTTTSTNAKTPNVPQVNTTQLQALADVCSTVNSSSVNPISNAVMNSLVSPTKVVTNEDIINPIPTCVASNIELPKKIPISIVSVPIMVSKEVNSDSDDMRDADEITPATKAEELPVKPETSATSDKEFLPEVPETIKDEAKLEEEDVVIEDKQADADSSGLSIDAMADDNNLSPVSAGNEPMECSSSLTSQISPKDENGKPGAANANEDVVMAETSSNSDNMNNTMQVESVESSPISVAEMTEIEKVPNEASKINAEDLYFLCDLFYLPFEHGCRGFKLLNEFNWLKANAHVLLDAKLAKPSPVGEAQTKPEVAEWLQRSEYFSKLCKSVYELLQKVALCDNKEICHDLFSYVWDIAGALSLLDAFVKWLSLGHFPANVYAYTQGSYTWFSKGWKEAFMSGDQEPWVFRGGLIADLQRLMPIDQGNDLFVYKLPDLPTTDYYTMRPYSAMDESAVNMICTQGFLTLSLPSSAEEKELPLHLNSKFADLIADSIIGPFVTLHPEFCIVATDSSGKVVGYAAAALDFQTFARNVQICWIPEMKEKYPENMEELEMFDLATPASQRTGATLRTMIKEFHAYEPQCPPEVSSSYPAVMTSAVLESCLNPDYGVAKRLITVLLATLRANGCFGVHIRLAAKDSGLELLQYYARLGFAEIYRDGPDYIYFGRRF